QALGVVGLGVDRDAALLERLRELAAAHVEARQPEAQERRVGVRGDRRLERLQRRVRVVLRERDLALEEIPERRGARTDAGPPASLERERTGARSSEPASAGDEDSKRQSSNAAGPGHEVVRITMTNGTRQSKQWRGRVL